jgi:mono/diheme cytochrome c family protein
MTLCKRWWLVVVLAGVAACGGGDGSSEPAPPPVPPTLPPETLPDAGTTPADAGTGPDPAAVARGEAVFQQHCALCHPGGEQGVGPSLITSSATPDQIRTQVRNGAGVMPPFPPSVISDQQLNDLIAYVLSLRSTQ